MDRKTLTPTLALSCLIMAIWSSGKTILGFITKLAYTLSAIFFLFAFLKDAGVIKINLGENTDE